MSNLPLLFVITKESGPNGGNPGGGSLMNSDFGSGFCTTAVWGTVLLLVATFTNTLSLQGAGGGGGTVWV